MGKTFAFQNPNDLIKRRTNLLILDYDVTRYHSFDLFRYLLLDRDYFMHLHPIMLPFVQGCKPIAEWVDYYRSTCSNLNPFDNFTHMKGKVSASELDRQLNQFFSDKAAKITETQLNVSLYPLLCSDKVSTIYIKYRNDPHTADCIGYTNVKTEVVDEMFCPQKIAKYIMQNNVNALLLSSIDLAVLIAKELISHEYLEPMTIMVCNYRYNYIEVTLTMAGNEVIRVMNHPAEITIFTERYQYEFCAIDPYTGLTACKRLLDESHGNPK